MELSFEELSDLGYGNLPEESLSMHSTIEEIEKAQKKVFTWGNGEELDKTKKYGEYYKIHFDNEIHRLNINK